jgi:hypothetical protein
VASGEFLPQAVQHPLKFFDLRQGLIRLLLTAEVQVYGDQNLYLQPGQRSFRVRKELYELSRSVTRLSFSDIGRDGNGHRRSWLTNPNRSS